MNIQPPPDTKETRAIAAQATAEIARKQRARRSIPPGMLGYGIMARVGWSIVFPAMLATLVGHWLDDHHPARVSWMLSLLIASVVLGSVYATFWGAVIRRTAPNSPQ